MRYLCLFWALFALAGEVPPARLTVRNVTVVPDTFPLRARDLKGQPIDEARAGQMAVEYRKHLEDAGYQSPEVTAAMEVVAPSQADVTLRVNAGSRVVVHHVNIESDESDTGLSALRELKTRWLSRPAYSAAAIEADIVRVRSAYIASGYVNAVVRHRHTSVDGSKATITLAVEPGERFAVQQDMCRCLQQQRREAEASGVLDFSARASIDPEGVFIATPRPGPVYKTGLIQFSGNRKFSDAAIRRNLLLNEAEPLNLHLLRRSIDRLNRSSMFEPIDQSDVHILNNAQTGVADVRIRLRERKAGSWLLSGPVGPVSLAGPARFTLASRLPDWGLNLLDLTSFYASLHLSTGLPVLALQRPFIPGQAWASGFAIAPQLGWKNIAAQYAGTQFRERVLAAAPLPEPPVPVVVERADGETLMLCEPSGPRWPWLKKGFTAALQLGSAVLL